MPLRHAYAPTLPEFDSFLFATVGEEVDGVPLSVLSALSRLDLDPRDEAARLSHLTKEAAADQLASMIARLSDTDQGPVMTNPDVAGVSCASGPSARHRY